MMTMRLTEIQFDALREAMNVGAGHATTRLAMMLGTRIQLQIPSASLTPIARIAALFGGPETPVTAVCLHIRGSLSGNLVLFFPIEEARQLADRLLSARRLETDAPEALKQSALKELGNIFSGAFVSALATLADARLVYSVPGLATDMLQAVLDGLLVPWTSNAEQALVLQTTYEVAGATIRGHVVFLPSAEGLDALLAALHVEPLGSSTREVKDEP